MFRIVQNMSAAGAKSYFEKADYYAPGQQELKGVWRGKGAHRLELAGEIEQMDWESLCDNKNPLTGDKLTARQKSERRVGFDLNWHLPKSVSLLYGLTGDQRILNAFQKSVNETMCEIESEAKARVRKDGRNEDRITGEMIWGEHIHFTARPIDGVPDPHVHSHCFVMNQTYDPVENRWKALQIADIKRDAPLFEARFHARMSLRMTELGFPVTRTQKGWEIAGFDASTLDKFSRRTAQIEKVARENKITDPRWKSQLGASTRQRKQKDLSMDELRQLWHDRLSDKERSSVTRLVKQAVPTVVLQNQPATESAAKLAVEHCFERKSVVPERTLLVEALKRGYGQASVEAIEKAVAQQGILVGEKEGRRCATTRLVLGEETRMLDFARAGRGACQPLAPGTHEFRRDQLNEDQRNAVRHILESRDRVILVSGGAGTGKTTMMSEAVEAIEGTGRKVFAFAPSADASRGVLRDAGFKDADTVARLLKDEKLQEPIQDNVIWIDEASLLGSRTMRDVFDLCDRLDARLLLTGDTHQHHAVERGSALRLLQTEAGLVPAEIKMIQRQRGDYREAVKSLAEGKVAKGFAQLDHLGWIEELPDAERYQKLAYDYAAAIGNKQTALVVSPTHWENGIVTSAIRTELKRCKQIGEKDTEVSVLRNANLTAAQRADRVNYSDGDTLVFHQNAAGFKKGDRLIVGDTPLPLNLAERFTVFRPQKLELTEGDMIRITHNGSTKDGKHRLNNGAIFKIENFTKDGDIRLSNGWTVARDFGHLSHGYAATSHASQGKTVDTVFIAIAAGSLPAVSREGFYVACSRGRETARVYTDDRNALLEAANQTDDRQSATEFINDQLQRERARIRHRQTHLLPYSPQVQRESLDYER